MAYCLCGHFESCSNCNPYIKKAKAKKKVIVTPESLRKLGDKAPRRIKTIKGAEQELIKIAKLGFSNHFFYAIDLKIQTEIYKALKKKKFRVFASPLSPNGYCIEVEW